MEDHKSQNIIDLREVVQKIWHSKKLFLKVWIITFVLSCLWILPQPRYYETTVMLAPETGASITGGTLGNLVSSFGINVGTTAGADAIYPLLYPDVVSSNDFIVGLFNITVKTKDGEVETDYLTYLLKHQKLSIWSYPSIWVKKLFKAMLPSDDDQPVGEAGTVNPYMLTKKEDLIVKGVRSSIRCSVDKKTDVVTISVSDQDPLVCATLADSIRTHLQDFIISYRTSKARTDVEYYERMKAETYADYQKAIQAYSDFCDTHREVILQSMQSRRDELENDMMMKFNTYNVMCNNLEGARAKVQERTPAFTTLQNASVPVKASKPKRMIFVLAMLLLASMATVVYLMNKKPGVPLFSMTS